MSTRHFTQVDVFSNDPCFGNPVAVVHDADGLDDGQMADFARWTNLSETTFLLAPTDPGADYRVRIFTPASELPFAGHPTLGTAHAWLTAGGEPATDRRIVQECGIGLVTLRHSGDAHLAFAAPPLQRNGAPDEATLAAATGALGIGAADVVAASWVDNGPGFLGLLLRDAVSVLALEPDHRALADAGVMLGVAGLHGARSEAAIEVRAFCAAVGIDEDPVTGSLNAGLARWLIGAGHLPAQYVAAQGTALGRRGRVHVDTDHDDPETIWIGGATTTVIEGTVSL